MMGRLANTLAATPLQWLARLAYNAAWRGGVERQNQPLDSLRNGSADERNARVVRDLPFRSQTNSANRSSSRAILADGSCLVVRARF